MSNPPDWLDTNGRKVYFSHLPRLENPTPERLAMLAAYAHCMSNLKRVSGDPEKSRIWRGAAIYCKNGLGLGRPVFISLLDLLIDGGNAGEDVTYHLETSWEIEMPANYLSAPLNY